MIELSNVSKSYDGGATFAVVKVSLRIKPGELVALLGTSGSGKTTTLRMINRLVPHSSGTISFNGVDISEIDPHALRRGIGYVMQEFGLFPHMTVAENVGVVPRLLGWTPRQITERVDELLTMINLEPALFRGRMPDTLSGGQAQRVAFARALAAGSKVMLMDEPFGALDPITRAALQKEFDELRKSLGLTVVLVTHDVNEALALADRIVVMDQGKIQQIASPAHLFQKPANDYVSRMIRAAQVQAEQTARLSKAGGA